MTTRMNRLALALFVALSQGSALAQTPPQPASPAAPAARTADELQSATRQVERAASWAGAALGAGAAWTRDELARAYAALGEAFDAAGNRVDNARRHSPFDARA